MKKTFLFSLLLTLLGTLSAWAEFNPTANKGYVLKEKTSGLYLDIQTLGINEPNAGGTTNNISLNANPHIIFFEAGSDGKWKMRNANGNYVQQASSRNWNVVIGSAAYEWTINEPSTGLFTIARADGKYISMDNVSDGQPLYCDKDTGLQFALDEYVPQVYYSLKSATNTYFSFTKVSGTEASFQENPTYFIIGPNGNNVFFESKDDAGKYIGSTHSWNTTKEFSWWTISEADTDGYITLSRTTGSGNIGSDQNTDAGTGIYTNVGASCNKWLIEGVSDYTTTASNQNGKMHFNSGLIEYFGLKCNKIRFTLTETDASYQNGKKRLSFDSFELYDSKGKKVNLSASMFSGNNSKTFANMLDGANGTFCCGAWGTGDATDDYFEILLAEEIDLGGAFSFSYVTENTTMNAKAFRIGLSYEKLAEVVYTFCIDAPQGSNINATYNGVAIEEGTEYMEDDLDIELFDANEISGYTWSIVVDKEKKTITLLYTEAPSVENPQAVVALVNRIGGAGTDGKFKFILDPSMNSKNEVFSINGEDVKILIKGSTLSAITTGLGWYLNHIAKINIAWNSLNEKTVSGAAYTDLSNIPVPTAEETHTSDAKYRYYLNTCTFGYSMTSWTWKRWQQEIDWMALHGINMPLQLVGLEEVWRKFLTMEEGGKRKYGYTDEAAKAFVAGPAFIAWWAMNNLEGWGGTGSGTKSGGNWAGAGGVQDDAWYARQKNLAKQITDRQRELGMQPVLPGWSGMVPTNFASKSGYATRGNGGNWAGDFVRPLLLSVNNSNYAEIAADYYKCLKEVMGESQYYSMDPFHEGGGAGTMEDYKALYDAMEAAKAGSQWVIQQWQWSATQKYSLTAVPAGRLVVLDLFSDGSPAFDSYNGYAPQDAVFCAIPNFGGRSGLMGRLQNVTDNYFKFKGKYASIKGIGAAPEAIEQTPVTYDLIFQLPWMNGVKPDVKEWVDNYAVARYGKENSITKEVWSLLRQSVLAYGADGIEGPIEDVWAARPNLIAWYVSSWGSTLSQSQKGKNVGATYTRARRQMLIDAVYKLIDQEKELALEKGSIYESNYLYDIVEFGGGVMADYAHDLLLGINAAKTAAGGNFAEDNTYKIRRDAFLQIISDMDAFRGTNLNFRLGKWTQEARAAAAEVANPTSATPDWYEYNNARTIVSTWSSPGTNLTDYSYRSWQGLLKDYYLPRWIYYFKEIEAGRTPTGDNYKFFEWNWAHGMKHEVGQTEVSTTALQPGEAGHTATYTRNPEGNTVELAKEMLGKYIIPVNNGEYYAYRYLNNDLTGKVTIIANAGTSIDLTQYFGALTGAVSGDFINGTATDLGSVAIKSDAADGSHTGALTLTDGTVLTFAVVINPGYYGVYNINYKNGDEENVVFVGYNEDKDNSSNVGYKLIATGTYSADAPADKMFTIVPNGTGVSISAQGKFLKSPTLGGWNHIMFSDNADEAGAYLIEETGTDTDIFKIRSTGNGINYLNDYDNLVFGNDNSDKANLATFSITEVTSYPLTITDAGMATLCLPFNVVMSEGMLAYDLSVENIASAGAKGDYTATMKAIAKAGETLKKGTPVIIKANTGDYTLPITMSDNGAKTSLAGSLLRGNFVKQNLTQGTTTEKYIFGNVDNVVGFYLMDEAGTIGANKCWMEWTAPAGQAEVRSFVISFDDATGISDIIPETKENRTHLIYNIGGQRLNKPQKGLNIVNGKKIVY
ncbi:MAG: alpha-N-acetylglucosaminidase [Bacteroidaceae bacterium]|nr:alpha-N-acetylglucosaminidase [Bacteroidaceae bacterium]